MTFHFHHMTFQRPSNLSIELASEIHSDSIWSLHIDFGVLKSAINLTDMNSYSTIQENDHTEDLPYFIPFFTANLLGALNILMADMYFKW